MAMHGKFSRRPKRKFNVKDSLLRPRTGGWQDTARREEHLRIAPKHPGMGRR